MHSNQLFQQGGSFRASATQTRADSYRRFGVDPGVCSAVPLRSFHQIDVAKTRVAKAPLSPAAASDKRSQADGGANPAVTHVFSSAAAEAVGPDREDSRPAEHVADLFWIVSVTTHELLYVSQSCEALIGRTRQELQEQPVSWLNDMTGSDKGKLAAAIARCLRGKLAEVEFQLRHHITRDRRWFRCRFLPVFGPARDVAEICGQAEDVTASKLQEPDPDETRRRVFQLLCAAGEAEWNSRFRGPASNLIHYRFD